MPTDGTLPLIPEKRKYYFNHTAQFSWVIFHLDTRSRANAQVARYLELNVIHGQSPSYNR